MSENTKNTTNNEIAEVKTYGLTYAVNAIKVNGVTLSGIGFSGSADDATKAAIIGRLKVVSNAVKASVDNCFELGKAIDDMRINKDFDKLMTSGGKAVGTKGSYKAITAITGEAETNLKEAHYLYTTFKKPCTDGTEPIKEIAGYPIECFSKTQLIAIMYAIKNADNIADKEKLALVDNSVVNPTMSTKQTKETVNKAVGKEKPETDKDNKDNKDPKPIDKNILNHLGTLDFIGKIGDIVNAYMGTKKPEDIEYKYLNDIYKTASKAFTEAKKALETKSDK